MFSRMTLTPLRISCLMVSGESLDGPSVATILVFVIRVRGIRASVPRFRCRQAGLLQRVLLQAVCVDVEFADAFRQLLGRHGVFVVHPTEGFLVQVETI